MTKLLLILSLILVLILLQKPSTLSSALPSASTLRFGPNQPLQLLNLQTKATVEGSYAYIEYTQTYHNPYQQPLETEFYFPRTDTSVFYRFEAIFQNQTVVGKIFEKAKAQKMYEWNVERGNTVAYSEKNTLVPDVMQIKVGNIPAGESVDIRFTIIQPLEVIVNKLWGFTLPAVLTERYTPSSVDSSQTPDIKNVGLETSAYKEWKVVVEVRSDKPFEYVFNPSHKLEPELSESAERFGSKSYKATWDATIIPDKDFTVYFRSDKLELPNMILSTHPEYKDDHVLLVNFIPELNSLNIKETQEKLEDGEEGFLELKRVAQEEDTRNAKGEFIFVIDRSGSMHELRIENLKRALIGFFGALPKDSFFNIVSFGSYFDLYKPNSVKLTPQTLLEVFTWIPTIKSDMGGTDILTAIQEASRLPTINGYPRTIMLLTDGDVYNPDEVVNHALINSHRMRFCGVGIGYGASEFLVKNLAKAGKCTSVFVQENEDIGEKALFMVEAAVSRYIDDINFSINCTNREDQQVYYQEEKVGMLLKDIAFKKWVHIKNIPNIKSCQVKIEYYNSLRGEHLKEEVEISEFQTAEVTDVWHKVAYDAQIKELDLKVKSNGEGAGKTEEIKSQIVEQSLKYQVLTDYTAFLAVIQESEQEPSEDRIKVKIPSLDSADYSPQESVKRTTTHTTSSPTPQASRSVPKNDYASHSSSSASSASSPIPQASRSVPKDDYASHSSGYAHSAGSSTPQASRAAPNNYYAYNSQPSAPAYYPVGDDYKGAGVLRFDILAILCCLLITMMNLFV